jgi:hypothetical protein
MSLSTETPAFMDHPAPAEPRLTVVVKGGRSGRTEVLDTPIDADGIARLADWLGEHQGWAIVSARAEGPVAE